MCSPFCICSMILPGCHLRIWLRTVMSLAEFYHVLSLAQMFYMLFYGRWSLDWWYAKTVYFHDCTFKFMLLRGYTQAFIIICYSWILLYWKRNYIFRLDERLLVNEWKRTLSALIAILLSTAISFNISFNSENELVMPRNKFNTLFS